MGLKSIESEFMAALNKFQLRERAPNGSSQDSVAQEALATMEELRVRYVRLLALERGMGAVAALADNLVQAGLRGLAESVRRQAGDVLARR